MIMTKIWKDSNMQLYELDKPLWDFYFLFHIPPSVFDVRLKEEDSVTLLGHRADT